MNYLIYCLLFISVVKADILIIPFKTISTNNLNHENYISELINNKIYIELKIGTPYQTIPALIKLNQVPFFITSLSFNKNINSFNSSKSNTYTQDGNKTYNSTTYDYIQAYLGEDIISVKNIENKDCFFNRTNFFLAINLTENNKNITGEIGLNIVYATYMSFINQLKKKKIIENYIFSLKYKTENEGEFHLGNYFHIYDNKYNESDFTKMEVGLPELYIDSWRLFFNKIMLSTGNTTYTNRVLLSYEYGLIYGTTNYYKLIKEIFFDSLGKKCEEKKINTNDFYFVCDDDINLENFPDLFFIKYSDINFTLTKNDIWKKFDGKYYFLIIFSEAENLEWILGKIFFKKYNILFNSDSKIIGYYPNSKDKENEDNEDNEDNQDNNQSNEKGSNFSVSWIIVIILFILLILAIIYIIYIVKVKNRKKRANELEDSYDYSAKENDNKNICLNT